MTTPLLNAPLSRFKLESHDHTGAFVAALPYRNAQGEFMLNGNGKTTGSQLRIEIPYRNYPQVTRANLAEGKHELWLYDTLRPSPDPIFAGPIWDITASSSEGVLACSAQDALSYVAKRVLKVSKTYSSRPELAMTDLLAYCNSVSPFNIGYVVGSSGVATISPQVTYKAIERNKILDKLDELSGMGNGVEYYVRTIGGVHKFYIFGGFVRPSTALPFALEYGGQLDGYSVQFNGQNLANDYDIVSTNGRVGNAVNAAKQTEYNALYQTADQGSSLTSTAALNTAAATAIKDTQSSKTIPSIVTRTKVPMVDFDFGDQFIVVINDGYVQVNQTIRVIGWQLSIGQGDKITTVIYTKDTEGVT